MAGWLTDPGPRGETTDDGRTVTGVPRERREELREMCTCGCNQTAQNCLNRVK